MKTLLLSILLAFAPQTGTVENLNYISFSDGTGYYVESNGIYLEHGESVMVIGDYVVLNDEIVKLNN